MRGISKKGLEVGTSATSTFLSSNGLLNVKIGEPLGAQLATKILLGLVETSDHVCVYNDKIYRVEHAMTEHLINANCVMNITDIADAVGVNTKAITMFKDLHWQGKHKVTINKKGTAAKPKNMGISIVNKKSLLEKLKYHTLPFQLISPLLESWDGAANVLREELEANRLLIVDAKYCTYTETPTTVDSKAKEAWFRFINSPMNSKEVLDL